MANIGEQLPNADAKVFEVNIEVDGSDPILRPSMTTGNKVVTKTIADVTYIPLESVQAGADSIPFVFLKNGTKQIVVLGESNENNVVIEQGLEPGVQIYLSTPESAENFKQVGEELIAVNKERAKAKKEEEKRLREEAEKVKEQRGGMMGGREGMNITPEMMQQFQNMRGGQGGQGGQQRQTGQQGQAAQQQGQAVQSGQAVQGGQEAQGRTRDTAAMRRFMNMRNQQGGQQGVPRDTAAMRRFMNMRNQQGGQQGQQGGVRDTSARRRIN